MSHIVSISRRTDVPAFYGEWLMSRLRASYVLVPNPYNPRQRSRISLAPDDVDAIVFWTKNPQPLLPRLAEVEEMGHRFYFQFTLNDYPRALEPHLPPRDRRIEIFRELVGTIGPERVVWRYDPIVVSNRTDHRYHLEAFAGLCKQLGRLTRRVVVSVVDFYRKTARNLGRLEREGFRFDADAAQKPEMDDLLLGMASLAREHALEIATCAEQRDFSRLGLKPGSCIDGELVESLWGIHRTWKKDPGQRKRCRCAVSRDIGVFDTCPHGCPYCYATQDTTLARSRFRRHDPGSEVLVE
jgi:hypothetical protein